MTEVAFNFSFLLLEREPKLKYVCKEEEERKWYQIWSTIIITQKFYTFAT